MEENTPLESEELAKVESLHEASRPSGLDLAARVYRGLISFRDDEGERPLIEDAYRLVRESKFANSGLDDKSRLSYFDKLQGMLESGNEFPEDSSAFFELEPDEYEKLKDEFDAYARDTTATYSAIEAIIEDMRNPLNSGQMVFKRIFGHFSQVNEKLGAQLSYNYFFNGNPFQPDQDIEDRYNIRSSVKNYFKRELLRSTRRYSSIERRLNQDFEFASQLQQNTDTYVNRPGILPLMDLIRSSKTAIDIDIFQLQNESVMDMLVAHKLDNPELKLRIKLASLDEGRIDRVSTDILAPNAFVSGVFEALNIYGGKNIKNFTQIEIYRARSRNHPKLIVGDKEAIIGSMNITYPLGNNPLKAGANFEIIRRVRNEEEDLNEYIQGEISKGIEISPRDYRNLEETAQKQYLNTYLYNQLKQVMDYNMERFKEKEREEDVPFYYEEFRRYIEQNKAGRERFGTGTGLVGGPSDMYTLLDISLGKLEEGREGDKKYGLLMNIDQPLILQGVLGKAAEVGYRVGEFGPFNATELSLLDEVMENFEKKSLQLLESIGRGEAFAVVDPRNYRTKVLNPFRAILDPLIGSDLAQYGGRLEQLVAAKASGTGYDERLANLTNYMRERVSQGQSGLAEGLAKQMLAITSSNIQMATHPKAHAKGFSLFEVVEKSIEYLINSMGSGNYTPGSTLPSLEALKRITGRDNISEEDYRELAKTSSNELSLQGYDPQVVGSRYDVGGSGFLAKELAKEQGKHLEHSFDELTYSGKFADIQRSIEEGGPSKFQGTDARWEQGVDIGRTAALQERIQTMFDESGLGERGATAELIRDNKSNASRILVTLNYNQLTEGSGLANKKYELSVMQGGQVYLINKGLIVSSAVFTNESGMTMKNFMGEGPLASGETKDLSSEDVAVSLFGTLALEALNQGLVEMPKTFEAQDTSKSAFYHFLAEVLGTDRTSPLKSEFINNLKKRFGGPEDRLKTLAKLSEELFKGEFLDKKTEQKYKETLKDILLKQPAKSEERLNQVLGLIISIHKEHPESRILHKVYSSNSAFSFELNERLQNLESNLLKPFLTYTQGHTYSASTETTRKIHLGITDNSFQQKAIETMNEGGPFGIAQYAAMALPYAGTISDISRALITSVAGGVAQISDDPLSTFFGTRTQSYEEVKSLDLIEILSVGSRLDKKVIEDYLKIRGEGGSDDEDVQEIEQRFIAKLGNNQFITTFGGSSKFSQIGQRLKNVGGSRALLEMSYSAQYLVEGGLDKNELVRKLSQDAFGFLFDPELLPRRAELEKKRELLKLHKDSTSFFKDFSVEYSAYLKEIDSFSSDSNTSIDTNTGEDRRDIVLTLAAQISEVGRAAKSSGLGLIITRTELGSLYTSYSKNLSEAEFGKLVGQTEQFISLAKKLYETKKQFEEFEGFTYDPTSADSITSASSLQQAYVENLRKALTLYGIDSNLAKSLVPDEYGVAAIAGGRIREVMPSDAYQVLLQDREELMQLTGKDKAFFEGPVGKELLRARAAYRDTETMGARGFLGSRRKEKEKGYSLLQLGGFYYDANFFYNPEYDEGVRYFFTDRVKKTVMANQLGLDNFEVDVQAGDVIRPIEGSESYAVYRDGNEIGRVSDRSQVKAISNIIDPLSSHNVPSTSTVTRKASTPPGRKANELVISKVQRASTSKAGMEIEISLARSVEMTGGSREDIAQGLLKGVGIGDEQWFEYAEKALGLKDKSSVFGLINESSMKSYIYGHGLTIAHSKSLQEEFLQTVRKDTKKAAAALLYMFGTEAFTEDKETAQDLETIYTEKALSGEFGSFFQEEAVALSLQNKSVLKSGFSRLQLPSLGIQGGSKIEEIKKALSGSSGDSELVTYIEQIVQAATKEPFSTTGAGGEGLVGREADLIITAIDFYQQLSKEQSKVLPPAFDVTKDESLRTLALGMNYSPSEIEEALQDEEKKDELIRNIASQSASYALRFYQIPTPGQMKTPLSSKTASKAEIQSRLNPFVTTGDSFSPSNPATKKIRGILTAGLLSIPSKERPASAVIKIAQEVNVASLSDEAGRKELRKLVSLQEAHKTLSSYNASEIGPFKQRLQKLGKFEAQFYKDNKDSSRYDLETLEITVLSASEETLDQKDKTFILGKISELRTIVDERDRKRPGGDKTADSRNAVKSLFFQAASEISMGVREQSLLFSQDSSQQYTIDLAQKFIKNLSSSGTKTLGLELPRLIEIGLNREAKVRTRYSLSKEDFATGVILEGEYLEVLKAAELQDFVTEVLSTQYKLQEMLAEGHVLKGVLRKLLQAQKVKSTELSLSLELTDEEHRAYTEFTNLLDQSASQLTESLSDSYIKKVLGAQESPGYVATGVGLLGLGSQRTVVPPASIKRAFEPQPHRKEALNEVARKIGQEIRSKSDTLNIELLGAEVNAIIEGISPEAKERYNLYRTSGTNFEKLAGGDKQAYLEGLVEKHQGQGDEYVYRVLLEAEKSGQEAQPINIQDFENRYVRNRPKSLLLDLDKDKATRYIKELEGFKESASGDEESIINSIIASLQIYLTTLEEWSEHINKKGGDSSRLKELTDLLNKISFQEEFLKKGYEPFIRSLRSAPTGSMIISKSTFRAIELTELNATYQDTAEKIKDLGIAGATDYISKIDPGSSDTLNILPLLSTVTTMLGDFDGDQIISSFVTYSDKILKRVKLNIDLDENEKQITDQETLLVEDPTKAEEAKNQIKRLKKAQEGLKNRLNVVEQEITALNSDFDINKINRAVISHVSRYLGIDESYFLGGTENYYYQLLGKREKTEYQIYLSLDETQKGHHPSKDKFQFIPQENASLEYMVSRLEQGRGLLGSLEKGKNTIEYYRNLIEEDSSDNPLIRGFIQTKKDEGLDNHQIAQLLAAAHKTGKTIGKIGSLAKGFEQDERSLMLSLRVMGEAGSVILGKTYNVLYGSLLADAPIIALKRSLENNEEAYKQALGEDLDLSEGGGDQLYSTLFSKVTAAFEKTQSLKAFTMSIEQMMRDSIKPKNNDTFLRDLKEKVEEYEQAGTEEEKNKIIRDLTKSLGSGPKGLLSLINLHDFLGAKQGTLSQDRKKTFVNELLGAEDLKIVTKYLGINETNDPSKLLDSDLDKVLHYAISRDVLNTSAGFMYERTFNLEGNLDYIDPSGLFLEDFKKSIKGRLVTQGFLTSDGSSGQGENEVNLLDIRDLGLKGFLEHYNKDSGSLYDGNDNRLTRKGFQAVEFWLTRHKDSIPLFGLDGQGLPKLKALKDIQNALIQEGTLSATEIETLDIIIGKATLEAASRAKGSAESIFQTLLNISASNRGGEDKDSLTKMIEFLDNQTKAGIYNSEEAEQASTQLKTILEDIKNKLNTEDGQGEERSSEVLRLIETAFGLTYTGEANNLLEAIEAKAKSKRTTNAKDVDYLSDQPQIDVYTRDPEIPKLESWVVGDDISFNANIDQKLAEQTADRLRGEGTELALESLFIPALILGHAIATGYDPAAAGAEIIGQQVVGGTIISALYSNNLFSRMEQNDLKDQFKRASRPLLGTGIGTASKVRLTMAQDEEDDIISGVIRTLGMEAMFTASSILTSRVIEAGLNTRRNISKVLDIDALESTKTVASFVSTALISAAVGLTAQNAVKQVIRPSALETLQSVVANINQYVSHQRTQTAKYETETVDMETEVDIPVYELTAITDYVQADMVSEHILSLSSTEMSGELIEEPIFVRSAEGEEV